jgi:ribosomal protein S27AE
VGIFKKECDHFFGPVDENNFQYCSKCGRAVQVFVECFHIWEEVESFTKSTGSIVKDHIYKQVCKKCGEIKFVSIDASLNKLKGK